MRNAGKWCWVWMIALAGAAMAGGCQNNPQQRQMLDDGEKSLKARQYDQAIRAADSVIATGDQADLAEAFYLRGCAIEDRNPKPDPAAAGADLTAARRDYTSGLQCNPYPELAMRLHERLGNVAYYEDDYAVAAQQLTVAYNMLDDPAWKAGVLYRIGNCLQRLGRFEDADRTFQAVQDQFPGTQVAHWAAEKEGVHGFYVLVGVFSQQADIDKAAAAVAAAGAVPTQSQGKGVTIVRTAGIPTYRQANSLRARLIGLYPDARVMP
jgi:tetratricopeptide (TPR) repeat protein